MGADPSRGGSTASRAGPRRAPWATWLAFVPACAAGGVGSSASSVGSFGEGSASLDAGEGSGEHGSDGASSSDDGSDGASTSAASSSDGATQGASTGACMESTWYRDSDGDGRGAADVTTIACEPPEGYVPFGDDCDDAAAARYPGAPELCDGLDDDCDALVDEASPSNAICNGCQLFDVGGRSYALCSSGATWDAARSACAAFTGDLLRIDDAAEQAAVVALPEPPAGPGGGWFIGLSDAASEGVFTWIDGLGLDQTAWNPGEPNDANGNEDCVEMDHASGVWNDVPCDATRAFVCESPAP